ncbi:hypothetical protein LEP1GSC188_4938 [Leptospira weilii serovar Topaz str. LT2116]|uniref:Uncharacterized protein n=1 Tax=Leptospira weilii serovar Topaz str. LT2116 TaxID=1088540 RepID=M3FLZ7_9LEPT|nr:hypothetical protein LEP1GSC188_4938 [Leptospira weilii serovar Topaz str. LT2116]
MKIPPKSEIEVFRFNVFHGEVKNLYGTYFTAGVYNYGGVKIGLFNSSPRGIGLSVGVINTGKDGNFF